MENTDDRIKVTQINKEIRKAKIRKFFKDRKEDAKNVGKWCVENAELAVPLILAAGGTVGWVAKQVAKSHNEHERKREEYRRDCRSWDPSLGEYLSLRRPLSTREKVELDYRMQSGERKSDILDSMNLLDYRH